MRNLGEEKVMYNMAVGNVVCQRVNSEAVFSVNGLRLALKS
jgi:hypothetical protein